MNIKVFISLVLAFSGINFFVLPNSIILLNGTTCSGKSTIAQVLAKTLRGQGKCVEIVSINDYVWDMIRNLDDPQYSQFKRCSPFKLTDLICDVFNQKVERVFCGQDNDFTIVDHCFYPESMFCCSLLRFARYDVFFVKIYCTYQKASERLILKNAVPGDSNRFEHLVNLHFGKVEYFQCLKSLPDFHANKIYDLEIDTTENSPEQCAQQIESILNTEHKAFRLNRLNDYWIRTIKSLYSDEIIAAFSV
ncbi:MAG: hypothetical protein V1646_00860 [bacterium]